MRQLTLECDGVDDKGCACTESLVLDEGKMCPQPHNAEWERLILKALTACWTVTQDDDGMSVYCEECTGRIKFPKVEDE